MREMRSVTDANVFAVASEEQKLLFAEQHQKPYFEALSLIYHHFQMDDPAVRFALELVLRRKGIVLDAQSRQQQALTANLEGEALESWQRLTQSRSHLSWLLLSGPGERGLTDYRRAIEELYAAIAREEEFLRQRSSVVAQELAQWQVTAQMLAERLPKASSLVEFVRIKDWDEKKQSWSETSRYLAFVLTPGNRVTLVDLGDAEKIDTTISKTLAAIDDPDFRKDLKAYTRRADSALSELYGLLLQPLGVAVRSRERLIVSPDGELNKVPFAALRTPDGQYLIEKLTVSYLASGRDLLRGKAEVAPTMDLLLVASPAFDDREAFQTAALSEEAVRAANYGERFAPLPGTAEEARAIPLLIKGTQKILEGRQATESAVRLIKSPRVLHLATHGFFLQDKELPLPDLLTSFSLIGDDQERGIGGVKMFSFLSVSARPAGGMMSPMVRSGLALAGANHAKEITAGDDGLLTALEVTSMNLYGTDLVVLSACNTAIGEVRAGDGVYGLRRAFVLAGARNLLMSLWPVNDKLTLTQMERFYQAYGRGETVSEALRQAQLETIVSLREQTEAALSEPLAPVKLWAPFIVQQTGE